MNRLFITVAVAAAALLLPPAGQAHQIWFEREGAGITFRYGELDANMHEVSPGGLDRFRRLQASWISGARGEQPLALAKQHDRFALPPGVKPAPGDSFIALDKHYPMFDTQRDGKALRTWWTPATRWIGDFSARKPLLPLDIVPTGVRQAGRVQFQLFHRGEPLAGEKLKVATPAGWVRTVTSDADGKFGVALPWRGTYAIGLYFVDEVTGEREIDGKPEKYQLEGYNTTLSFHVERGLAPLPVADETLPASVRAERGLPPIKH
jgi:hypothetical protein